ncbi:MAG: ParA family protein [Cyanobacteria bacterium P01_F01_bin.150]
MSQIISVAGYKGGISKTTVAVHVAACLSQHGKVLLIDADENRSAERWSQRTQPLPFPVVPQNKAQKVLMSLMPEFIVIDTKARPSPDEFQDIAEGCDLLILPTTPRPMDIDVMVQTVNSAEKLGACYRVLLSMMPPTATRLGADIKQDFDESNIAYFNTEIRKYAFIERLPLSGGIVKDCSENNAKDIWRDFLSLGDEIQKEFENAVGES